MAYTGHNEHYRNVNIIFDVSLSVALRYRGTSIFKMSVNFTFPSYIMRCRIKITLNNLKVACPDCNLNVKGFLKQFDKEFDYELRARNKVHHRESFEDRGIDRISITGVLSASGEKYHSGIWRRQHRTAYRKFSKEWSLQARHRALRMQQVFVEAVALGILTGATFLRFEGDSR